MRRLMMFLLLLGLTAACSSTSDSTASVPAATTAATSATGTGAPREPATTAAASTSSTTQASTTTTLPAGPTPWTDAIDAFDAEGSTDVGAALGLFTLAFGSVPGLPEPARAGRATGDVTLAVRAVLKVWDQLTDAQRTAVTTTLTPPADSSTTIAGFRTPLQLQRPAAPPDPALVAAVVSTAQQLRTQFAAKVGDFSGKLNVVVAVKNDVAGDLGVAMPTVLSSGTFSGDCTVTFFPNATGKGAERLLNTIAHEVFHCFQLAAIGSGAGWGGAPGWVIEGGAEWAAATITVADDTTAGRWTNYLTRPQVPLQLRKYDGLGFWAHLAESGTDPWSVFRTTWAAVGTAAAFVAAGANTPAFLDSWASGFTRDPGLGPAWDTTGPSITADVGLPKPLKVPSEGQAAAAAVPYANGSFVLDTAAEVLTFAATGNARLADGTIDTTDLAAATFCHRSDGCGCPGVPDDIPPAPLADLPTLAVTGGPAGSSVIITGATLQKHCELLEKRPVQVVLDRPAGPAQIAGRVLELTSCNGAYGDWNGVLRLGGISTDGFEVPFQDLPMSFTVGGSGTQSVPVALAGNITTPVFNLAVSYDLTVTVDGSTMTITGTGSGDTGLISVSALPTGLANLPIQDAPPGACPTS
ncbi:MAG: hypothetical protein ABIR68_07425 [Ilumatobacteraceae bacterium]